MSRALDSSEERISSGMYDFFVFFRYSFEERGAVFYGRSLSKQQRRGFDLSTQVQSVELRSFSTPE